MWVTQGGNPLRRASLYSKLSVMWKCASCGRQQRPPSRTCPKCRHATKLPSNVALAGEDECHLLARFSEYHVAITTSATVPWQRIEKALEIVELNRGISINMPAPTLVSILQEER